MNIAPTGAHVNPVHCAAVAPHPKDVVRFTVRSGKRIAVSIVGGAVVLAGLAMVVLPGPGFLVVIVGLAILATEYAWAARALERTKDAAKKAADKVKRKR